MIRPMSSVVRTVQENILKRPFSTSRVVRLDFNKMLKNLEKEQMKAVGNDTPVYIRDGAMYFIVTSAIGLVAGVTTFQSTIQMFKAN